MIETACLLLGQSPAQDDYRWIGGILLAVIYVIMHIAGKLKKDKEPEQTGPVLRRDRTRPRQPPARPAPPTRAEDRGATVFEPPPARPAPAPRTPRPTAQRPAPARPASSATRPAAPERPRATPAGYDRSRSGPGSLARAEASRTAARGAEPPAGESSATPMLVDIHAPQAARSAAPRSWRNRDQLADIARSPQQIAMGIVLAEILAPPVALRDNHLSDRW
ncbi:MAG: hypothetical protein AB7Q17_09925 [Phycisphaerae bacterium]